MATNNSTATAGGEEEQRFLRAYSKALADAILANEAKTKAGEGQSASEEERVRDAYVALCHDDPIVRSDDDCRRLAKRLVESTFPGHGRLDGKVNDAIKTATTFDGARCALSDPLLGGILQAAARTPSAARAGKDDSTPSETDGDAEEATMLLGGENWAYAKATASGYAELAYVVFAKGPFLCCQRATDQARIQSFLGSYRGRDKNLQRHGDDTIDVDRATRELIDGLAGGLSVSNENDPKDEEEKKTAEDHATSVGDETDNDSMKEIFAEESDDSDFEFESSYDPQRDSVHAAQALLQSFDPLVLSKPNTTSSWRDLRRSIKRLLSELNYNKLACLNRKRWKELGISDLLASFTLLLLGADEEGCGNKQSILYHLNRDDADDEEDTVTKDWTRPLHVLRDRALDVSHGHDALEKYVSLVHTLLQPDSSAARADAKSRQLRQSTAVGLVCLSNLCTSNEIICASKSRDIVRKAIIASLDDLSDIVELVRPVARKTSTQLRTAKDEGNGESVTTEEKDPLPTWVHVAACLIPVLDFLSNVRTRFDFTLVDGSSASKGISVNNQEAQMLLNSGLFRGLILLFAATKTSTIDVGSVLDANDDDSSTAEGMMRNQIQRALLALCAQSPSLLGKYATRVPEFTGELQSDHFYSKSLLDATLWALLTAALASDPGNKSRLRLKGSSSASTENISKRCLDGFLLLCDRVETDLVELGKSSGSVAESNDSARAKDTNAKFGSVLVEFVRFTNCIERFPTIARCWSETTRKTDGATKALEKVRAALMRVPSAPNPENRPKSHSKSDDNKVGADNAGCGDEASSALPRGEEWKRTGGDEVLASLRKGLKVLSLLLDSEVVSGLQAVVPTAGNAVMSLSSKTD